jgi:hypothetical protein
MNIDTAMGGQKAKTLDHQKAIQKIKGNPIKAQNQNLLKMKM